MYDRTEKGVRPCSGHGVCKTMREAAAEFDGLSLVRAPVSYDHWDADKIQGCLCDAGWMGFDCSFRTCPYGRDPTEKVQHREAEFILQCQADSGYFSILALGGYTPAIPFDADPGYLKYALESISQVGSVTVSMPRGPHGLPVVCGSSEPVSTSIHFDSYLGDRPPIFVTPKAAATRMWPDGNTTLGLTDASPILRMASMHVLSCPICPNCHGKAFFTYGNSVSAGVNITLPGGDALVTKAISALADLLAAKWPDLQVNVTIQGGQSSLCSSSVAVKTTIAIYSSYGMLPSLGVLGGHNVSLTLTSNAGSGSLYECSNQGVCNRRTGICDCLTNINKDGEVQYQAVSSDGKGNPGNRGDCGYLLKPLSSCYVAGQPVCGGRGFCSNTTNSCQCYDGWTGLTCELRECPKGYAIFDEPINSNSAHQMVECSNMGVCDRSKGVCLCHPLFSGTACQVKDCVRDSSTGEPCNGHGSCVNMASFYRSYGLTYGSTASSDLSLTSPPLFGWEAFSWHECVCSAKLSAGFFPVDVYRPSVGPSSLVSGAVATSDPLPGWGGWDCSKRNCPKGDTVNRRTQYQTYAFKTNNLEIQRVQCVRQRGNLNYSDFFQVGFFGETSQRIYNHYTATQIKWALEYMSLIGNVTITFPNENYDNVTTACSSHFNHTHGGFLVQFDTEFGDLPLLSNAHNTFNVTVTEFQKGNNTNLECGGSTMGFCDRSTGLCLCNRHQFSSNGTMSSRGAVGDCSFFDGHSNPSKTRGDAAILFGLGNNKDETFTNN